jgi:hypothetical protein
MKRAATLLAVPLAIALVVAACASMQPGGPYLVARAVSAQGGADALASIKTISYKATVRQWEPEQSAVAGGDMRLAGDSTVVSVTDVDAGATRNDWVRNFQYRRRAPSRSARSSPRRRLRGRRRTVTRAPSRAAGEPARPLDVEASGSRRRSGASAESPALALEMSKSPDASRPPRASRSAGSAIPPPTIARAARP